MRGLIVKGIAGFYYVKTENGIYECKARGLFKNEGITPMIGDIVEVDEISDMKGYLTEIHDRKNQFIRPPISNVEQFVIVVSAQKPGVNYLILDKFLTMAECSRTDILLVINKVDVAKDNELKAILDIYKDIYPCVVISAATSQGIDVLRPYLRGKVSALAGVSGVGKTTLLNRLQDNFNQETGDISKKTGRGKHTTRHVEIFDLQDGGSIFDTPGFTSFDILDCDDQELAYCYPEFEPFLGRCKYDNCRHMNEPECAVRDALNDGKISESRYNSYKTQLKEIMERRSY